MTGVRPAILLVSFVALTATACGTKVPPVSAGEPFAQPIVLEDVPRHVDIILRDLQVTLLVPVREVLRGAPVSTKGVASDGSYGRWVTEVTEAMIAGHGVPKDFEKLSKRAYRDLARVAGRPTKGVPAAVDLDLLGRRLVVYFEKQSPDARKTGASYVVSAFSIPG